MTGSLRQAAAGSEAAFPTPCLNPCPRPKSVRTNPDRRSPSLRGGEQSRAYHFRPRRAVEIRGCRGSRDYWNVRYRATSCGWEINWRPCAWPWIVRHRSLRPQGSQWQCPLRRYPTQRRGRRLGRFPCRRPRRCRLYSGLVSSLALWSSNPAAGSEAAFPTPCLDTSPCPVVVSVVGIRQAGPGQRTARCWARAEAPGIPNQPDRRSPDSTSTRWRAWLSLPCRVWTRRGCCVGRLSPLNIKEKN